MRCTLALANRRCDCHFVLCINKVIEHQIRSLSRIAPNIAARHADEKINFGSRIGWAARVKGHRVGVTSDRVGDVRGRNQTSSTRGRTRRCARPTRCRRPLRRCCWCDCSQWSLAGSFPECWTVSLSQLRVRRARVQRASNVCCADAGARRARKRPPRAPRRLAERKSDACATRGVEHTRKKRFLAFDAARVRESRRRRAYLVVFLKLFMIRKRTRRRKGKKKKRVGRLRCWSWKFTFFYSLCHVEAGHQAARAGSGARRRTRRASAAKRAHWRLCGFSVSRW